MRLATRTVVITLVVVAGIVVLCALTIYIVPYFADKYFPTGEDPGAVKGISKYGLFGEMFGAVSALYSGLALSAIAMTLYLEARSRKESRKPLVIGMIDQNDGIYIGKPTGERDTELPLKITVKLENQSIDAALNVNLEFKTPSGISISGGIDGPLIREASQEVVLSSSLVDRHWRGLLDSLTSNTTVEGTLLTKYRSLEGLDWTTKVIYELSVRSGQPYVQLLNSVRNGEWRNDVPWDENAIVPLSAKIKKGSWDHTPSK